MDIWKKIVGQHWPFYSHQQLYDMVKTEATGPGAVSEADDTWREFTTMMAESRDTIDRLLKETGASWQGLASESMQAGVTPLAQWADDAHTAGSASNGSVQQVGESFSHVANSIPEPVKVASTANSDWGGVPAAFTHLFGGQTDQDRQMQEAQQAKQRAVELMQGYSRNAESAVSSVGTFVPPQSVTVNVPPPQLAGGTVGYESGSFTGPSGDERRQSEPDSRREPSVPETRSPDSDPGQDSGSVSAAPPRSSTQTTTPDSFVSPTPGVVPSNPPVGALGTRLPETGFAPVTGFPMDPRTGLPVDPRTGRPIGGQPGSPGSGPIGAREGGEPGRGGRGGLTGSAPLEAERVGGARGGPGVRAGAGVGGAMGPLGGGAGASREEDKEHRTPEYLRDHHDDWYELPSAAPPAVGEEEDTTRPDDQSGGEGTP